MDKTDHVLEHRGDDLQMADTRRQIHTQGTDKLDTVLEVDRPEQGTSHHHHHNYDPTDYINHRTRDSCYIDNHPATGYQPTCQNPNCPTK